MRALNVQSKFSTGSVSPIVSPVHLRHSGKRRSRSCPLITHRSRAATIRHLSLIDENWRRSRSVSGVVCGWRWAVSNVEPLKEHVRLPERRSPIRIATPALAHQIVRFPRASGRSTRKYYRATGRAADDVKIIVVGVSVVNAVSGRGWGNRKSRRRYGFFWRWWWWVANALEVIEHLSIVERRQGARSGIGQDFPQSDAERPHIALRRQLTLHQTSNDNVFINIYITRVVLWFDLNRWSSIQYYAVDWLQVSLSDVMYGRNSP